MLNAGKNKLTVMDEVKSIVSLCALILHGELLYEHSAFAFKNTTLSLSLIESPILSSGFVDNEITSICRLEQMKELNTLGMIF